MADKEYGYAEIAGVISTLVLQGLDALVPGDVSGEVSWRAEKLAILFDDASEFCRAVAAGFQDGRLTTQEVEAILDTGDDLPASLAAVLAKRVQ